MSSVDLLLPRSSVGVGTLREKVYSLGPLLALLPVNLSFSNETGLVVVATSEFGSGPRRGVSSFLSGRVVRNPWLLCLSRNDRYVKGYTKTKKEIANWNPYKVFFAFRRTKTKYE